MVKFLKSLLPTSLFALTSTVFAQDCDPCDPCVPKDPCANCAQLWPSGGPDWIITPNAGPCVLNGADIFLTGEFIYWTLRQDHMAFAVTNETVANAVSPSSTKGKAFHPDWTFSPGFKVGLGILFDCDGWDLYANYTWLQVRNTKEEAKASGALGVVDYNWAVLPNNTSFTQSNLERIFNLIWVTSTAKWELDFNVIDVELGRNFFISQCLHLRPHFGLKGTWQKQNMNVSLLGMPDPMSITSHNAIGKYNLDYWGIGIRAGLDSAWHFTPCLSLVAEVAASALWERFDSDIFVFSQNLSTALYAVDAHFNDTFHTIKPVLELLIGLRWENWFCCNEYHWSIEAGWEEQWWADQNQFISTFDETRQGDLTAQGFTLKLRFDF